ncbi:MAG TPA: hypothetical protein VJK29_19230, partial [Terriglobales bacterium]|nr:hypothetical protein [Terriglobales bacterium]
INCDVSSGTTREDRIRNAMSETAVSNWRIRKLQTSDAGWVMNRRAGTVRKGSCGVGAGST